MKHIEVEDIRVKRDNNNMNYPWFAGLSKPVPRRKQFVVGDIWKLPLHEISQASLFADGPVSYTHLRAHETKANLVCRLLLEKKKAN